MPGSGSVGSHSVASIPVASADGSDTDNELLITFTIASPGADITLLSPAADFTVIQEQ